MTKTSFTLTSCIRRFVYYNFYYQTSGIIIFSGNLKITYVGHYGKAIDQTYTQAINMT